MSCVTRLKCPFSNTFLGLFVFWSFVSSGPLFLKCMVHSAIEKKKPNSKEAQDSLRDLPEAKLGWTINTT